MNGHATRKAVAAVAALLVILLGQVLLSRRVTAADKRAVRVASAATLKAANDASRAVTVALIAQCQKSAKRGVAYFDRDFAIYTADADSATPARHVEAVRILFYDSYSASQGVDTLVLGAQQYPRLEWPAIRAVVRRVDFSCVRAYPSAPDGV
jgi:hypothetical protein